VYELGVLRKKFNSFTSVHSTTSQTSVAHQTKEVCETIQKLNVELMAKDVNERTLEEKMEQFMKSSRSK